MCSLPVAFSCKYLIINGFDSICIDLLQICICWKEMITKEIHFLKPATNIHIQQVLFYYV